MMTSEKRRRCAVVLMGVGVAVMVVSVGSSSADVTTTSGGAFGARGSISLFGGAPIVLAPTPSVTLPSSGGSQGDSAPSAVLQTGPVRLVNTGPLTVNTQGTTGVAGSVTSSASVSDPGVAGFTATEAASTCTATEAGFEGSATIAAGTLATKRDAITGEPITTVDIPADPPPNDTYNGTIDNVGDSFRVVFNEQIVTAGAITVNAVHFYLLGPIAVGELFVGQSVCGIAAVSGPTTSTTAGTATSTSTSSTTSTSPTSSTSTTTTTQSGPTTSTTTSSIPAAVGPAAESRPTADPDPGGGPLSTTRPALARTGSTSGLTLLGALTSAVGVLLLIGSGRATAPARHRRPRRLPWERRRRW